jgi:2-hydroxychromene-2-carboxylate isomerase
MEKTIKLFYDYSSPESFFGDVEYLIEQKEGKNFKYDICRIYLKPVMKTMRIV